MLGVLQLRPRSVEVVMAPILEEGAKDEAEAVAMKASLRPEAEREVVEVVVASEEEVLEVADDLLGEIVKSGDRRLPQRR